jgi:hypothetical protein
MNERVTDNLPHNTLIFTYAHVLYTYIHDLIYMLCPIAIYLDE